MKTTTLISKCRAGTAGLVLVSTVAFAGPGSGASIWRSNPATPTPPVADAPPTPMTCTDARLISVKETKWVRGGGRGMTVVDAGKRLVCNSCVIPVAVTRPADRNSNGPKANTPSKGLHECGAAGCGAPKVASAN